MNIRDKIITGSYAIGHDGKKEPLDWKDYALKLEEYVVKGEEEKGMEQESVEQNLKGAVADIDKIRIRLAQGSSRDYLDIKLYELTNRIFRCMDLLNKKVDSSSSVVGDYWDEVLTNVPVRVHPMTENYFKNNFIIKPK
jgi:hypothetical protein